MMMNQTTQMILLNMEAVRMFLMKEWQNVHLLILENQLQKSSELLRNEMSPYQPNFLSESSP